MIIPNPMALCCLPMLRQRQRLNIISNHCMIKQKIFQVLVFIRDS